MTLPTTSAADVMRGKRILALLSQAAFRDNPARDDVVEEILGLIRDGADLTALSIDYDGARTLTVKGVAGEVKHCLPIPMDKGYWSDGQFCERHDIVTHDGIAWIALRDTREAPSVAAKEDWRIFARKGRDGKDGRNGIDKTAPVDLEPKPRKP